MVKKRIEACKSYCGNACKSYCGNACKSYCSNARLEVEGQTPSLRDQFDQRRRKAYDNWSFKAWLKQTKLLSASLREGSFQ